MYSTCVLYNFLAPMFVLCTTLCTHVVFPKVYANLNKYNYRVFVCSVLRKNVLYYSYPSILVFCPVYVCSLTASQFQYYFVLCTTFCSRVLYYYFSPIIVFSTLMLCTPCSSYVILNLYNICIFPRFIFSFLKI